MTQNSLAPQLNADLKLVVPARVRIDVQPHPKIPDRTISVAIPTTFAYHTPISATVFQANYRVLALAKDELFGRGIRYAYENGPKIARLVLLDAAKTDATERGTGDVGQTLLDELCRLTTILAPGKPGTGFHSVPPALAIQEGAIDQEEWAEVESGLVFFTCAYAMANRIGRAELAESLASVLRGSVTSLSPTAYIGSLTTSTPEETSPGEPTSALAPAPLSPAS